MVTTMFLGLPIKNKIENSDNELVGSSILYDARSIEEHSSSSRTEYLTRARVRMYIHEILSPNFR